jgi:hypothetical protein
MPIIVGFCGCRRYLAVALALACSDDPVAIDDHVDVRRFADASFKTVMIRDVRTEADAKLIRANGGFVILATDSWDKMDMSIQFHDQPVINEHLDFDIAARHEFAEQVYDAMCRVRHPEYVKSLSGIIGV